MATTDNSEPLLTEEPPRYRYYIEGLGVIVSSVLVALNGEWLLGTKTLALFYGAAQSFFGLFLVVTTARFSAATKRLRAAKNLERSNPEIFEELANFVDDTLRAT
jgi:hypothetical protein